MKIQQKYSKGNSRKEKISFDRNIGGITKAQPNAAQRSSEQEPARLNSLIFNDIHNFRIKRGTIQTPANINNSANRAITLSVYDRCGRAKSVEMQSDDICIIGPDDCKLEALATKVQAAFSSSNKTVEIISPLSFTRQAIGNLEPSKGIHVVLANINRTVPDLIEFMAKICPTSIVFGLDELKLFCPLSMKFKDSTRTNQLIVELGGDFDVRKALLASLGVDEFIVIGKDNEHVFSLTKFKGDR